MGPSLYIMSQVWSSVVSLPGFTLSSVAWLLQGNVAQETRREGAERRTRDGECEEKCRGGGGLNLNHRKKNCHTASFPHLLFISIPSLFSSCEGWCWEELQECYWGFLNFCSGVTQGYTLVYTHRHLQACCHAWWSHTHAGFG